MKPWISHTMKLVACTTIILAGSLFAHAVDFSAEKNIVDNRGAEGSFTPLMKALQAAGLIETLKGTGPFTVFAPNDAAFARLPKGMLDDLLKPENKASLASILTYHVMPGKFTAADVEKMKQLDTVNGDQLIFTVGGNIKAVDNAKVLQTDIACSNGLIHIIDTPVIPPTTQP
jgi:uncharacterized surface protein with fasciclin (FAS1) repeats